MKSLNNKFDKLVAKHPIILQIGQLIVLACVIISVMFTVHTITG